ncbi:MAG: type II secretion system ATPase GspE [Candidatus Binatia bacterium]
MPLSFEESVDNLLLRAGVTREQIERARRQSGNGNDFAAELEKVSGLSQNRFAALVAERLGLSFSPDLDEEEADLELPQKLGVQYCRRNHLLPLREAAGRLRVATSAPATIGPLDDVRVVYGLEVDPVVVPAPALQETITRVFDRAAAMSSNLMEGFEDDQAISLEGGELEVPDLLDADDEAPIIRLVNNVIFQAAKDGASDIHIEPFERNSTVRFRIDGMLVDVLSPPRRIHAALVSRIKVMASLNIAEKRLPQDGSIRTRVARRDLDVRVSTLPTSFGERVVMRLLDRSSTLMGLEELGLVGPNLDSLRRLIHQSHGIVLVTGPTGSGKTTTLYAALSEINSIEKNIITIEDPVEYQLAGVGQIQVNPKIELTFAAGLRSILRQDPDVIMVGEIRDGETARIAIQAALTGHLVLSTLHTNDSFSAITRLLDMGIEPFLVSSSVIGILAQRLVRRLCPQCSRPVDAAESGLAELGLGYMLGDNSRLRVDGAGCESCRNTGFRGRTALHELLAMDDTVRSYVMQSADAASVREICVARGMPTLRDDGADKVRAGATSVAEVLRVTAADVE